MKSAGDSSLNFVSLRMTNTYVFRWGEIGCTASDLPLFISNLVNACHSERSNEPSRALLDELTER